MAKWDYQVMAGIVTKGSPLPAACGEKRTCTEASLLGRASRKPEAPPAAAEADRPVELLERGGVCGLPGKHAV